MLNAALAAKSGCYLVYRKSSKGHSLLSYAVETCNLLQMTNETLDHLLSWCEIRIAKTSTKATKARKLMETQRVQSRCSSTSIEKILAILKDQEEKRKKKKKTRRTKATKTRTLAVRLFTPHVETYTRQCILTHTYGRKEIQWEELAEDPATAACQQLLDNMQLEED